MYAFLTAPTAPRSLMVVNVTDATIRVSWEPPDRPNGIITQYQIHYKNSSHSFTSLIITNADLTYTVTGLTSGTKYVFRVRAFTVVGHGPPSKKVITHTSKLQ